MLLRRAERPAALAVAVILAIAAVGAIVTAPGEYPVTAFLLAPLAAAIVANQRVTAVVAVLATIAGAVVAIGGSHYEGAALWFRLAFLGLASFTIVALTAARQSRHEQTASQQELLRRRSEQRYRSLVEATSAIVWRVTPDGRFAERQPAWEHYTGQPWPEYAGHGWLRSVHPEDRERFVAAWLAARADRRVDETDCRLWNHATNAYRFVVARGVPIVDAGVVREWIGTVTDVHDRTEAILRAAEDAQLRTAVLQSLQDGVFVASATGCIIDVNDAWPRLFGRTRDEVLGMAPPYEWWPDPDSHPDEAATIQPMRDIGSNGSDSGEFEVVFRHADGHFFPALVTISTIPDDHGGIAMHVGTVKDMSRHAAAEARLRLIASLTARLGSANELDEVGAAALAELMPHFGCSRGIVFVVEHEPPSLALAAASGFAPRAQHRWSRLPIDLPAPAVDALHSHEMLLMVDQEEFFDRYPGLADYIRRLGYHTTLNLPLIKGDVVLGVLFLAFDRRRPFSSDETELLSTIGPIVAQALDRAGLFEFQRSVASTLQRAILNSLPDAPADIAVAARYVPAVAELSVGGDWYDVVALDDARVAVAVGDIVGRGINAAAVMGQLRSALSALARTTDSAVEAVARLDRFAHGIDGAKATTLLYGIVDAATGTLRYTSAGHPPALVVDRDGTAHFLDGGRGWPLAVAEPARPRPEAVATLTPGSTILLYTDGLIERRNERLEDGLRRLAQAAASRAALPVEQLCDELLDELVGDAHADDVALVALRLAVPASRSFTCRIPAEAPALARVRRELRAWLSAQELPDALQDDMLLAVGEACSNAVEHAYTSSDRDTVVVEGFRDEDELVFTVRDYGSWRPLVPNPERNRGLRLINEVTDDVSISSVRDGGTRVEMRRSVMASSPVR
jgi:PAS domain S-box-containing protein